MGRLLIIILIIPDALLARPMRKAGPAFREKPVYRSGESLSRYSRAAAAAGEIGGSAADLILLRSLNGERSRAAPIVSN